MRAPPRGLPVKRGNDPSTAAEAPEQGTRYTALPRLKLGARGPEVTLWPERPSFSRTVGGKDA